MLTRILRALLPTLLVLGCASMHAPWGFLHTHDKTWNDWLDTVVDVDVHDIPLAELFRSDSPTSRPVLYCHADCRVRVTMHMKRVTRRQVLRQVAKNYRLRMHWFYYCG